MYRFTQGDIDLDELRAWLRKMTDAELIADILSAYPIGGTLA